MAPRFARELNAALHELFLEDPDLVLLGEDVLDPYGGAFSVTRGLSSAYPDRVITTPISEAGIVGVATGLALAARPAIVEIMFSDFLTLAVDPLVNMAAKARSMYGRDLRVPLVVRCPSGGRRGYGATHSQSLQRLLLGVPGLGLYEASPVHDPVTMLRIALRHGPSVVFEDKVLYTERMLVSTDDCRVGAAVGPNGWVPIDLGKGTPRVSVICAGGVLNRVIEAATSLVQEHGAVRVLVPGRLFPLSLDGVHDLVRQAPAVVVADDGAGPGGWGSVISDVLQRGLWRDLACPPVLVTSAADALSAARHLEDQEMLSVPQLTQAIEGALRMRG